MDSADQPDSHAVARREALIRSDDPAPLPSRPTDSGPPAKPSAPSTAVTHAGDDQDPQAEETSDEPPVRVAEHFEQFYLREFRKVEALIYLQTGSRTLAEDATQNAFLVAFREWSKISCYDEPGAWVRRVAIRDSMKPLRRAAAELRALGRWVANQTGSGDHSTVGLPEPAAEAAALWALVRKRLPRRQAQVLTVYYQVGCDVAETARILGMAEGTVKATLYAGRKALGRLLDPGSGQRRTS